MYIRMIAGVIGSRFGKLVVSKIVKATPKGRVLYVDCICDCGKEAKNRHFEKMQTIRKRGGTSNCDICKPNGKGIKRDPAKRSVWTTWQGILQRCIKKESRDYPKYGGRGITVHSRYQGKDGFKNFLEDIGLRPGKGYDIDRLDNNKGYEPGNIKWRTRLENNNNRSCTKWIEYNGQRLTIKQLADMHGLCYGLLRQRIIQRGWTVEDAINIPPFGNSYKNLPIPTERYSFRGQTLTRAEICRITGVPYSRLDRRLKKGLTAEQAATMPPIPRSLRKYGL